MFRRILCLVPVFALVVLAADSATAQDGLRHPRLHAALSELREARKELMEARDNWPPGQKEQAMGAINDAMRSLMTILSVREDNFRGLDRGPDFYKRFGDHPRLRAALHDLREAREELLSARADFGNMKERALRDIDAASQHIGALMRR